MAKGFKEKELVNPFSVEFEQKVREVDPRIEPKKFWELACSIARKSIKELPDNANDIKKRAHANNVNFVASLEVEHNFNFLVEAYEKLFITPILLEVIEEQSNRLYEKEMELGKELGFDPVEAVADIDRPNASGMTRIGMIIMLSDNVAAVRELVEVEGASPEAKCGNRTPLEIARQLGRSEIVKFLESKP